MPDRESLAEQLQWYIARYGTREHLGAADAVVYRDQEPVALIALWRTQ